MIRKFLIAGAAAGLAACSSSSTPPSGSATASATTSPSMVAAPSTSSSSPTGPTISQFVSIVAKDEVPIRQAAKVIEPCQGVYGFAAANDFSCNITWSTVALTIDSLRIELKGAITPSAGGYLGSPPAEITTLVADTLESARLMHKAQQLLDEFCTYKGDASLCQQAAFTWQNGLQQVMSELGAWSPYTH